MHRRFLPIALAVLFVAVVASGCGGGTISAPNAPPVAPSLPSYNGNVGLDILRCTDTDPSNYSLHWFRGVGFRDASTAFVTGDAGSLYAVSGNFAQPASLTASAVSTPFDGTHCWGNGVTFTDATHGYVVGYHDLKLYTRDGGLTWTKVEFQDGFDKYRLISPSAGTLLLTGIARPIEYSNAAGDYFVDVVPPYPAPSAAPDQRNAFHDVAAASATHIVAVGTGERVDESSDGGRSWGRSSATFTPALSGVPFLLGVAFDGTTGLGAIVGEEGTIYLTSDGGVSWSAPATVPSGAANQTLVEAARLSPANIVIAGQLSPTLAKDATTNGIVWLSNDGGATWQTVTTAVDPVTQIVAPMAGLLNLAFYDSQHGLAVGLRGRIYATADGGAHWSIVHSGFEQ